MKNPYRAPLAIRHPMRRLLPALALGLLLLGSWSSVSAQPEAGETDVGAVQAVKETIVQLVTAISERREAIRVDPPEAYVLVEEIIEPRVDIEGLSAGVLGPHWHKATMAQKDRFANEFRALMVRIYATAVIEFADAAVKRTNTDASVDDYLDKTITYLPGRVGSSGRDVYVPTRVRGPNGAPITVDYRMHRRNGQWKVYDLVIEGVSLTVTYRSSFRAAARAFGFDGLIERLVAKNHENSGA